MKHFKKEKFWVSEHFALGGKTPLFSTVREFDEAIGIIEYNIKSIKETKSPRLVILETWFVLDYIIRSLIISGLNLERYFGDDFNITSEFLPQSFDRCVRFLENFINMQRELLPKPENNEVHFRGKFAYFIRKEHEDFYDTQYIPILKEYYKKYYPELIDTAKTFKQMKQESEDKAKNLFWLTRTDWQINNVNKSTFPIYREVSEEWFKVANQLNNQWFIDVKKINQKRNISAHNIKSEKIYESMGINGNDEKEKLHKLKQFCIQQLSKILDIYIPKKKRRKE